MDEQGRERKNEYARAYRARTGSRTTERRRSVHRKNKYGLTLEAHAVMLAAQEHQCGICGRPVDELSPVDHDHETGRVRGILCTRCNLGLGALGDNVEGLQRAMDYLSRAG